jgi:hypothetical protein
MQAFLKRNLLLLALSSFSALPWAASQTLESASIISVASTPGAVPPPIPYSGAALDAQGRTLPSPTSITFLIFKDQTGGEPLFAETQRVTVGSTGPLQSQSWRHVDRWHSHQILAEGCDLP